MFDVKAAGFDCVLGLDRSGEKLESSDKVHGRKLDRE